MHRIMKICFLTCQYGSCDGFQFVVFFLNIFSKTVSMRDKEKVLDYRFMPEPNLPPLCVYKRESVPLGTDLDSVVIVEDVQACLKELPGETRKRITEIYDIPLGAASTLVVCIPFIIHLSYILFQSTSSQCLLTKYFIGEEVTQRTFHYLIQFASQNS